MHREATRGIANCLEIAHDSPELTHSDDPDREYEPADCGTQKLWRHCRGLLEMNAIASAAPMQDMYPAANTSTAMNRSSDGCDPWMFDVTGAPV